jgi:hypothetical protein
MTETPNPGPAPESKTGASHSLPARKSGRGLRLFLYIFWYGILIFLMVFLVTDYHELNLLAQEGQITSARVTSKRSSAGKSESYHLICQFEVNGRLEESSESVTRETYKQTHIGDPLTITYLPANPSLTRMGKVDRALVVDRQRTGILIVSFLAIVFTTLTWYVERCARR